MDCEKKIDLLFGELEEAADVLGSLEDMKLSLLNSKAWQDWLEEMNGSYISEQPLRPQKNFHEILTEAQSILTKKIKATKFCSFRNLLRENIGFTAPHDQQEKLRALRPDIVVVTQEHLRSNPPVYGEFRCVMEHKRGIKVMQNSTAIQESLVRSLQTFNDNFLRHYLYSVFVAGTKLRLFRLHRGGIVYYDADVDIENNPETFMKFVAWLSFASPEQLGYGKDFDSIGGVRFQCEWNNPSRRPKAEVLDSRGTTVWTVKCPEQFSLNDLKTTTLDESLAQLNLDDKTPRILETQRAILKMQWAYETRTTTEAEFLREISDMPGVPKLIAECTGASTKDFSDPDSGTERIPLIANHTPTISITSSAYETSKDGSKNTSTKHSVTTQIPTTKQLITNDPIPRQQRWILISYCGASIDDISDEIISSKPFTPVDRIRALRSVINRICKLFCRKRRIVHRDISAANIRIAPRPPASESKHPIGSGDSADGNLIDFDMASYWATEGSGTKSRTGTPVYMAANILCSKNPPTCHLPWYDIESVFWVLLIGEAKRSGEPDVIEFSAGVDLRTLGLLKLELLVIDWLELKERDFMQGPVGKLLCRMRRFLFDNNWEPIREQDSSIAFDISYGAERFKTQGKGDQKECAEDMATALKKA